MAANEATQQANRAEMDPKRLVAIAYLLFGVVIALFLGHMLDTVFARFNLPNGRVIEGIDLSVGEVLAGVLTMGAGIYCWTSVKIRTASIEVANELMRVTWPSWEEVRVSTAAVVVASVVASFILFGIDTLSYKLIVDWLPVAWTKLVGGT
jgi:preprotein translocase subunit SecE